MNMGKKSAVIMLSVVCFIVIEAPLTAQTETAENKPIPIGEFTGDVATALADYTRIDDVVLAPDSRWIALLTNDETEIWTIPAVGGHLEMVFRCTSGTVRRNPSICDIRFSGSSREILFTTKYYDESRGSIKVQSDSEIEWYYPFYDIESVDIFTGEYSLIMEGARSFALSSDGRFLVYENQDMRFYLEGQVPEHNGVMTLLDLETNYSRYLTDEEETTYYLPSVATPSHIMTGVRYRVMNISRGNQYVYYTRFDLGDHTATLYRLPLFNINGTPERLSRRIWRSDLLEHAMYSSDKKWIMYPLHDSNPSSLQVYDIERELTYNLGDLAVNDAQEIRVRGFCWKRECDEIWFIYDNDDLARSYERTYGVEIDCFSELYAMKFNPSELSPVYAEKETTHDLNSSPIELNNYPNPFNPITTIAFNLPTDIYSELTVINTTGQKTRTLVSGLLRAGSHRIVWDGCDEDGVKVASGVYVVRLVTGKKSAVRRIMLVR